MFHTKIVAFVAFILYVNIAFLSLFFVVTSVTVLCYRVSKSVSFFMGITADRHVVRTLL